MVDVEHRGLAAFEEHRLTTLERLVQQQRSVGDHRPQPVDVAEQFVDDLVDADGSAVVDLHEQVVLLVEGALYLLPQDVLVEQVLHADADAVDLVGVGGPDAAAGGADLPLAEEALGDLVERAVVLGDEVRVRRDAQLVQTSTPRLSRPSSSSKSTSMSTTTPFAMTGVTPGVRMPDGSRCSAYFSSPMTTVWPALLPPLNFTT